MFFRKNKTIVLSLVLILSCVVPSLAQNTVAQRLDIMRRNLDTMRRSLDSATSVLKQESKEEKKKVDKTALDTPYARLTALEKEAATLQAEVNNLKGKIDRSEKYEQSEVDQLETTVVEFQKQVDNALTETAGARANPDSLVGTKREIKKKKKFFRYFRWRSR